MVNITGGPDLTLPKVNEIMTAVTEQFGRDSHVIMGAVIDETMHHRVEICVLGTSDLGSRLSPRRAAATARERGRGGQTPAPTGVDDIRVVPLAGTPENGFRPPTAVKSAGEAKGEQIGLGLSIDAKAQQNEFSFSELESRGYFDKTDRNLFEGQDLDVPTYLRKGIKIAL